MAQNNNLGPKTKPTKIDHPNRSKPNRSRSILTVLIVRLNLGIKLKNRSGWRFNRSVRLTEQCTPLQLTVCYLTITYKIMFYHKKMSNCVHVQNTIILFFLIK